MQLNTLITGHCDSASTVHLSISIWILEYNFRNACVTNEMKVTVNHRSYSIKIKFRKSSTLAL